MRCSKIFLLLLACTFFFSVQLTAQPAFTDSGVRASALYRATHSYVNFIGAAAPLYTGPQYVEYYLQINDGQPFFLNNTAYHKGSVVYDDILYENVALKLDLVLGQLVLSDVSGIYGIAVSYDKVKSFTILDHSFVKKTKDNLDPHLPLNGYYEVLYTGNHLELFKKEHKRIGQEITSKSSLQRFIVPGQNYYLKKDNRYFLLNKKGEALDLFKDKKTELRQFMKKNNTDFSKDADVAGVVAYYESLSR